MKVLLISVFLLSSLQATSTEPTLEYSNKGCSPFESYDDFIDTIGKKNPMIPNFMFKRKFKEQHYRDVTETLDCQLIKYRLDGITVSGVQIMPRNIKNKKLPVIIYNRGGNGSFGSIVFASIMNNLAPLAKKGFIVVASQYRGVTRTKPELYGKDEFGGKDVHDVHYLIDAIKSHPNADEDNIFMYGVSRGGMMTYMVAKDRQDIRAIAVHAGVTNLLAELEVRAEMENVYKALIPEYHQHRERELKKRSVMFWADRLPKNMPILLHHGDEDIRVNVRNATQLAEKLKQLNHPHKLRIFEGEGHILADKSLAYEEVISWFKHHSED